MHRKNLPRTLSSMMSASLLSFSSLSGADASSLAWSKLAPVPDAEGYAGMFAGVSDQALIVAGGANIVGNRWDDPMDKRWYDSVFVLNRPDGHWKKAGLLHRPVAYGVSITTKDGIICIGGGNSNGNFADVFRLSLHEGTVQVTSLPSLPMAVAYACGALAGQNIYVAGGIETPDSSTLKRCWTMDIAAKNPLWKEIEPWPGPSRQKAVAGAMGESFYLFGGATVHRGADGKLSTTYLTDAYCYTPTKGWQKRADLPFPAVAAPSPSILHDGSELLIIGGDDGSQVEFQPPRDHPPFQRRILAYSIPHDRWKVVGSAPFSRVTAPTVLWETGAVIPSGEMRPRVRSPEVWWLQLK